MANAVRNGNSLEFSLLHIEDASVQPQHGDSLNEKAIQRDGERHRNEQYNQTQIAGERRHAHDREVCDGDRKRNDHEPQRYSSPTQPQLRWDGRCLFSCRRQ